jgi:hypothetical protein
MYLNLYLDCTLKSITLVLLVLQRQHRLFSVDGSSGGGGIVGGDVGVAGVGEGVGSCNAESKNRDVTVNMRNSPRLVLCRLPQAAWHVVQLWVGPLTL